MSRKSGNRFSEKDMRKIDGYRVGAGTGANTFCGAGSGSLRTAGAGAAKPSTSRIAGTVASAMAAWPSAVG
jgi:hypothetical protein